MEMFVKGNSYGKGRKRIKTDKAQWLKACELWNLGFSIFAISKRTLIPKSQLVKVFGYQSKRIKKNQKEQKRIAVQWYADISDLTFRSIKKANKHAKVFKTTDGYYIKIACATNGKTIILMFFASAKRTGEHKEFWNSLLLECVKRKVKAVAVDTNAKFDDEIIKTVKLPKTTEKPYNTIVEQIFTAKRYFYTYVKKHAKEELTLNHVVAYLVKMYSEKFYDKKLIMAIPTITAQCS